VGHLKSEKSQYLAGVPLKRSISAEKEVHGTEKICLTQWKSHSSGVPDWILLGLKKLTDITIFIFEI